MTPNTALPRKIKINMMDVGHLQSEVKGPQSNIYQYCDVIAEESILINSMSKRVKAVLILKVITQNAYLCCH